MMVSMDTMPCLRCGRALEGEGERLVCSCGSSFVAAEVDFYRQPGFYREWLAALSCACGRVNHYTDNGVAVVPHKCFAGGVMNMPSPYNS